MDGLEAGLRVRPLAEFLGQSAVLRVRTLAVREPFCIHQPFHADVHGLYVHGPAREQRFQRTPLRGRVRMQWEVHPLHVDLEVLLQLFNTPGTEVAPRSDVIGEYCQCDRLGHSGFSLAMTVKTGYFHRRYVSRLRGVTGCQDGEASWAWQTTGAPRGQRAAPSRGRSGRSHLS